MKWVHRSIIFSIMAAIFMWISWTPPSHHQAVHFPWQIKVLDTGESVVFGLTLGQSPLHQALSLIDEDLDVAIFEAPNSRLRIEAFYSRFHTGMLKAKLVLELDLDQAALVGLHRQYSAHRTPVQYNGFKVPINFKQHPEVLQAPIVSLTYSPVAKLEADTITTRFGQPAQKIQTTPNESHWLYPDKGLSILRQSKGKVLFQYVPPKDFQRLVSIAHSEVT